MYCWTISHFWPPFSFFQSKLPHFFPLKWPKPLCSGQCRRLSPISRQALPVTSSLSLSSDSVSSSLPTATAPDALWCPVVCEACQCHSNPVVRLSRCQHNTQHCHRTVCSSHFSLQHLLLALSSFHCLLLSPVSHIWVDFLHLAYSEDKKKHLFDKFGSCCKEPLFTVLQSKPQFYCKSFVDLTA